MARDDLFAQVSSPPTGDEVRDEARQHQPLAARMRPRDLSEFVGQSHILGSGQLLRRAIEADRIQSLIFYGPPGTGKTSLAQIIARQTRSKFERLSGVESNVADMRRVLSAAANRLENKAQSTILFIDEIHRFNKAQQDVLLPDVEGGIVRLIGATTHNPFFFVNSPLVSRSQIFELRPLSEQELFELLNRALADEERGLGFLTIKADPSAMWARGISIDDLSAAIKNGTSYTGAGQFDANSGSTLLRPQGQLDSAQAYSDLIVGSTRGAPVYLRDVATVRDSVQDERLNMRFWARGYPVPGATVVLAVFRQAGANAVEVANSIRALLPQISAELPGSVRITPLYDRSRGIVNSVNDVQATLMIALRVRAGSQPRRMRRSAIQPPNGWQTPKTSNGTDARMPASRMVTPRTSTK